jgi:phosphoglycolate phosphatase
MQLSKRLRAVVFDFDGTLARPALDFPLMKRRIADLAQRSGVAAEPGPLPALEWIRALAATINDSQARIFQQDAHAIIEDMEREAAARTTLFPFARQVLDRLRSRGVTSAVITRNNRSSVDAVFPDARIYLPVVLTREDVREVKPDPSHLLSALDAVGASAAEALMVGDHPQDVLTARRAGTLAAAVASGGTTREELALSEPDFLEDDAGMLIVRLEERGLI